MKKLFALILLASSIWYLASYPPVVHAQETPASGQAGFIEYLSGAIAIQITGAKTDAGTSNQFQEISSSSPMSLAPYLAGRLGADGQKTGFLPLGGKVIANLFELPSSREYMADILDNMGLPTVNRAYAQGTGYTAMSPFLPFWKVFRNLAYSLYIIMFVVVGIMIMLRTKVNAQTIITIQSALPNLLITLILITFSYAIVGFMIDLMYFIIYFLVYLMGTVGIIGTPLKAIDRLMSYSAWGVIFEGRNSIISAVSLAIGDVLSGLGTGGFEVLGTLISWITPMYLVVALTFAIAMVKLLVVLLKSYVMIIVQLVTSPLQLLLNALPGSKAFSGWLKKTASYLIPFPVAAAMFIFSAILVGDPTQATIFKDVFNNGSANPFGINQSHEFYSTSGEKLWMPPFTLTGSVDMNTQDIMVLLGFIVFLMTPAAVKMAQDWLQVKESPYTSEAFGTLGVGVQVGSWPLKTAIGSYERQAQYRQQAKIFGNAQYNQPGTTPSAQPIGSKEPKTN
ncbi:MAG: hypothetical protein UX38_C0001G0037 [Microgenomates group bacterium GW2011_GWC1_46_16]|uniref:TrbL/VirB6 plasmid conjugal transfer protein n=1 Tax=Candidatus Collierbacteria bacterium RIFOXYA2_FULL_46_10 TaxID=1817726 RepID=A0A1F5F7G5_9BACT|nr:MAG: hypothetical protein UX38_C0001G0037 [Microgenomates group bacterium GW2011_GWC1_46_16]KKU27921.1 MAG: hypothetical protein UX40_C0005G0074 [Microgenomates group bacterium GW2011_GWF2_46_18]KKU44323.1 MAG: hypothetical protein UX59_C0001G0042 [Microgenomates group bacterium GW2011_GWA1_46_7]KKU45323.1 MAG: hypothetical protein UX63_C0008G0033 [Microgenomates group bacterium GW2011_GWB1_46_7]OGD75314.1 MAG: hypothetical protein A2228_03920 [Candidatus Collierbacteria bacterium RIFOXYA2_F